MKEIRNPLPWTILGAVPGAGWPAVPAPGGAAVLSLLFQLEQSQWSGPDRLLALQLRQLQVLLEHACANVPYYRERLAGNFHPSRPLTPELFSALPILSRSELTSNYEALKSRAVPAEHGGCGETRTSGSTGVPVRVLKTQLTQLYWSAFTLREHLWHKRDVSGKLATIRHGIESGTSRTWGAATDQLIETGPAVMLHIGADVDAQLGWLARQNPDYLMTYPSNLGELARTALARGIRLPSLRGTRTLGEVLSEEVRELIREAWGVAVTDIYSADEIGYLALQCPDEPHYHVQSEGVLLEILDEEGRACAPGETGRVVVTDLHNFATPLVRYELGDYAEAGEACSCGRGLPVLRRILGRSRNMLVAADGRRYWPFFGTRTFSQIAPVQQQQFVQRELDLVEARLVVSAPLIAAQEEALRRHIQSRLPPGFRVSLAYCREIPRSHGGKFEDFLCEVAKSER